MTRENKLALVLGFGLMLFVGILVSDHLAARQMPPVAVVATSRRDADIPPLPTPGTGNQIILTDGKGASTLTPLPNPDQPTTIEHRLPTPVPNPNPNGNLVIAEMRTYQVKEGDTFAAIAAHEYGKTSLGQALAEFNATNPSKLKIGATIKLPTLAQIDPTSAASTVARAESAPPVEAPKFKTYDVKQGDTLYRIAQREMGKGERWKELQKSNTDVLKDSEDLTPGMQLKIPVMTASAARSTDA